MTDYPKQIQDAIERDLGITFNKKRGQKGPDARLCYGACCTWFGSIHEAKDCNGIPCCPHCKGVLLELPNEGEWWKGIDDYEKGLHPSDPNPHPGYRAMWEWQRAQGKCFVRIADLIVAYSATTQEKPS